MSSGQKKVLRLTATSSLQSCPAPDWSIGVYARNDDGSNSIIFNFDGGTTHYYTLEPKKSLLISLPMIKGENLHYTTGSGGGTAVLELILWG